MLVALMAARSTKSAMDTNPADAAKAFVTGAPSSRS